MLIYRQCQTSTDITLYRTVEKVKILVTPPAVSNGSLVYPVQNTSQECTV